jgi:hypothetical protein
VDETKVMKIPREPSLMQIGQKQPEKVKHFKYLDNITNGATYIGKIKSRTAMEKAALNRKALFTSKLDLNLRKRLLKSSIWSTALYGAETWKFWKVDQIYLESFEMLCWRRTVKIIWPGRVRSEVDLLHGVKEDSNILQTIGRLTGLVTSCIRTAF